MVDEAKLGHFVASLLDHLHDGVVQGILVLLQPPSQVVGDHGGVVDNTKVSVGVTGLEVGLAEVGVLPEESVVQLGTEGLVCCLGEHGLLLKDGQKAHGLLKHVDTFLEIHAEVHVGPVETLADVLLLLKGEHVLVEELLQLLVDVVDADLLEAVVVEDLKAGDVKNTDVGDLLHGWVAKGLVTLVDNNPEEKI